MACRLEVPESRSGAQSRKVFKKKTSTLITTWQLIPDQFRSGSLIIDQSNKDLIRNQGTIFFSHKILEDIGGKVPSFLISLDGSLILDQSY